jgi:SAM-dependent methyltransferase
MFDTYAEIFEKRATEYHYAMRQSPRARDSEFLSVLEPIRDMAPGLVCDMPSGGGYLADYLSAGMGYLAIDPATDFFVEWPKPLQRLQAEITSVPLADDTVDAIVSLAGLHHEPSLPLVFGEMRRLLRTGGRVVLMDVAVDTAPARFLNGFVAQNCPLGHDGRFLDDRTAPYLTAAGFNITDDRMIDVPWTFDSLDEAGDFCRNLFGMTALGIGETAEAMEREIGFDMVEGRPRLRWVLRRLVADAI